jgi:uncharacterized OsmC-like protein
MYNAIVENKGDSKYYATTRHSGFVLDTEEKESNPIDALLASLCACMGHYVRDFLGDRRIPHSGFSLEAKAGITPDKARLARIDVHISVKDAMLDDRQVSELLRSIESCKIHKIMKENPGLTVSLTSHQPEH